MLPKPYLLGSQGVSAKDYFDARRRFIEEWKKVNPTQNVPPQSAVAPTRVQASLVPKAEPPSLIQHANWCSRFNIPTDREFCDFCVKARTTPAEAWTELKDDKPALQDKSAAFIQGLRAKGAKNAKGNCPYRKTFGETMERICCGGRVNTFPMYRCAFGVEKIESKESLPTVGSNECAICRKVKYSICTK